MSPVSSQGHNHSVLSAALSTLECRYSVEFVRSSPAAQLFSYVAIKGYLIYGICDS